jgi:hypothetical protein
MGQRIRKNITSGEVHSLLEQVMFEHNKPSVECSDISENVIPVLKNLINVCEVASDIKVCEKILGPYDRGKTKASTIGVKGCGSTDSSPYNGSQSHSNSNCANSVAKNLVA